MHRLQQVFRDGLWVLVGQLLAAAGVLASLKVWAVYLTPEVVGLMGLVVGAASTLVGVMIGPYSQALLVRFAANAESGGHAIRVVAGQLFFRQSAFGLIIVLAGGIALAWLTNQNLALVPLAAGMFIIDARRAFEIALLAARRRQAKVAFIYGGDAWLRVGGLWGALYFLPPTAESAILGVLVGALTFFIASRPIVLGDGLALLPPVEMKWAMNTRTDIGNLARPLIPAAVFASSAESLNRYLIAMAAGLGSAGLFVVAYGLAKRPYGLVSAVTDWTMRPVVAGAIGAGDARGAAQARWLWLCLGGAVALLGIVLFYLLKAPIVSLLLSESYREVESVLVWIALALAFFNIANIFGGFALTGGNSRAVLINNAAGALTGTVLTVPLSLAYGLHGAAWALAAGYLVQLLVSINTSRSKSAMHFAKGRK